MWIVKITTRDPRTGHSKSKTLRMPSDRLLGLADDSLFSWDRFFKFIDDGALLRADVDYRPTPGVKRIKRTTDENGQYIYYLTIDHAIVGKGYSVREEAWNQTEAANAI